MDEFVCLGPENRGWRDAQVAYARALKDWEATDSGERGDRPVPSTIQPVMGDPVWCGKCAGALRRMLAELDDLAAIYAAEADGHRTKPGSERVSGSAGRRSPSPVADDLDELYGDLHGWESAYRGEDPQARRGYLATSITTVVAWLGAHFDGIITNTDIALNFGQEVRQWHKKLRGRTSAGAEKHTKKRPCPRCDQRTLTWKEGEDYVECESCGRLMTLDEYDHYDRLCAAANLSEAS
ncbi:MAG: hypothetical protein JWN52_3576 [Actinomycetia bacterium]|nr:hypothetical protein [Actinomycetes bacterium]